MPLDPHTRPWLAQESLCFVAPLFFVALPFGVLRGSQACPFWEGLGLGLRLSALSRKGVPGGAGQGKGDSLEGRGEEMGVGQAWGRVY